MSEWREQIVRRFVPRVARVTAVSDPDGLLRHPGVIQAIQASGFSIVQFELESGRFSGDNQAFDLSSQSARCSANPTHWSVSRRNFLKLANSARTVTTSTARMYWDFFLPRNT